MTTMSVVNGTQCVQLRYAAYTSQNQRKKDTIMSHFAVAVFFEENGKTVEELLQPYHEFECDGTNDEFVIEKDVTEELRKEY